MRVSSETLEDLALELAWSLWGELGVRGVVRGNHRGWSIDPEPLIAFTASEGDRDPRLRDESLDWIISNERLLSRARLRGILARAPSRLQNAWGTYAATLSEHSPRPWPDATQPRPYQPTHKSRLPPLSNPSMLRLRLRALFGVGARAEILHCFLADPPAQLTAAELARATGYSKRNITDELERLELAGLLQVAAPSNQYIHRLHRRQALLEFVGDRPAVFPNWEALFRVVAELLETIRTAGIASERVQSVELEKAFARLGSDVSAADVAVDGEPGLSASTDRALALFRRLASGQLWNAGPERDSSAAE